MIISSISIYLRCCMECLQCKLISVAIGNTVIMIDIMNEVGALPSDTEYNFSTVS